MATSMSDHSSSEEESDDEIHDADAVMYDSDDGASFTSETKREPRSKPTGTAADAEFLESMDQTSSITDLHRSNLLRLQTQELVSACQLELNMLSQHVQWADVAHGYVQSVTCLIETIPATTVRHSKKSPFALQSDKKDIEIQLGSSAGTASAGGIKTASGLQVEPMGCYQAGIGLTVPSGNANVLPTLDLVIQLPNSMFDSKDYLRHRYFDVRTTIHIV
jgi:hypothetical protein